MALVRIGFLVVLLAGMVGCGKDNPPAPPAAKGPSTEKLPPEVTGDPPIVAKKKKK